MKKLMIIVLSIVMLFSVVAMASAQSVLVNRAEIIPSYQEIILNVALENNYGADLGRTRVTMMSYDMPFIVKKRSAEFDEGNVVSYKISEPAYVTPGFYVIRLSAGNEGLDFHRVVHREVYIDGYGNVY